MRKVILLAIFCSGVFYAPVPLVAQNGGGPTPLIPVVDMPVESGGGATAPSEPPLEVDPDEVPDLVPPAATGEPDQSGGASPPSPSAAPAPAFAPAPAPTPTAEPALGPEAETPPVEPAQAPDEPIGEVPEQGPTDTPDTPDPDEGEDEQDEDEFEEEFDDIPDAGDPDADVTPQATAPGRQLPQTGADLPALLVSGLSLMVAGFALRALVAGRA